MTLNEVNQSIDFFGESQWRIMREDCAEAKNPVWVFTSKVKTIIIVETNRNKLLIFSVKEILHVAEAQINSSLDIHLTFTSQNCQSKITRWRFQIG